MKNPEIEYTYKLLKGPDSHLYVSIGPLMKDIELSIEKLYDMNIDHLSDENKQIFDLKLLGLKTVYEFLGALQTEQLLKDKAMELNGQITITTDSNFTLTGASPQVH